ncbi:hypothetical protein DPEC_G00036000 [Dallia pectoralis]|uniref:Uncharacterized protein n=1 Tax=Dallia pectoralis TaxID=75939 RepID=A0ACC2HDK0_DALPE|nr:hypothetical protein DPEC_G00036000 [Dallia pectoralis]
MYRFSVWICVSLLVYGYSAKPYKSRGKASWTAVQETLMSDEMGKMQPSDLGQKPVEAPEDLDLTDYSFSDSWKNIRAEKGDKERQVETVEIEKGQGRYSTAEEDMDDINHPSQLQLEDTFAEVVDTQQPEQDLEKLYHPEIKEDKDQFELFAPGTEFRGQLEPEEDRDHIYHEDPQPTGGRP